jgi:hypothetical protein
MRILDLKIAEGREQCSSPGQVLEAEKTHRGRFKDMIKNRNLDKWCSVVASDNQGAI